MIKKIEYFILALLVLTLASKPIPLHAAEKEIHWQSSASGLTIAKATQKAVFLFFYASWCGFCTKMAKETFKDEAVIDFLNANFIAIRVNFDKEKTLADQYKVRGLPATVLISSDGKQAGPWLGYISNKQLLALMKQN